MTTDWEKAAEAGDILAAAELSAQALAKSPDDPDLALAALVCQSNVGHYEEVLDFSASLPLGRWTWSIGSNSIP